LGFLAHWASASLHPALRALGSALFLLLFLISFRARKEREKEE